MQPGRMGSCPVGHRAGNWQFVILYRVATIHNIAAWGGALPTPAFTPDNIYSVPVIVDMGDFFNAATFADMRPGLVVPNGIPPPQRADTWSLSQLEVAFGIDLN